IEMGAIEHVCKRAKANHVAAIRLGAAVNDEPAGFVVAATVFYGMPRPAANGKFGEGAVLDRVEVRRAFKRHSDAVVMEKAAVDNVGTAAVNVNRAMKGIQTVITEFNSANLKI